MPRWIEPRLCRLVLLNGKHSLSRILLTLKPVSD